MARIVLQNVNKSFAKYAAVKNLNIEIADGELLVLLGPSGCGKTTTMNMIAGLTPPSSGRIVFDNEDVTGLSPHQRNIAMVFQSSLLYPHLTARQNIFMSLKRSGLSKQDIDRRIQEAAATVDVTRLLDKLPSELSGGERQRVATAKAIVRHPACFLLDEPLGALDAALRLALRSELVNLQKRLRTTMIFVTHDQVEAMTMGDRIGVMRSGSVEQIGTPDEIYNHPETLFVAGFVGSPPMNFLSGNIGAVNGTATFANEYLRVPVPGSYSPVDPSRKVTLAIRPQHLRIQPGPSPAAAPVTVYAVEHLGNESVLIADAPDKTRIRAVVPPGFRAAIGELLHVSFDPSMVRLFDQETERPVRNGA